MPHAHRTVLQVAIIETEAGINEDALDAVALGNLDLPREVIVHHRNRISAEIKVADFADVLTLHVTNDHCRVVSGDQAEQFIAAIRAGKVEDVGAGLEAGAARVLYAFEL